MNLLADKIYFEYEPHIPVLQGVSLELRAGTITGLFGPNGCGKSTLLRCMNCSLVPQNGEVKIGGETLAKMSARQIARRIAVVPQDRRADIPLTVMQMVMLGRYAHLDVWGDERHEDVAIVRRCMEMMDVADLAARAFCNISGGQQQRVIIARAIAQQTDVLLMDEAAANVDISHQLELCKLARKLADEGMAILVVCHDLFLWPMFVDNAVLMFDGEIIACGKVDDVLSESNIRSTFDVNMRLRWERNGFDCDSLRVESLMRM